MAAVFMVGPFSNIWGLRVGGLADMPICRYSSTTIREADCREPADRIRRESKGREKKKNHHNNEKLKRCMLASSHKA